MSRHRARTGHGPLFWRVYMHGVMLLVVVAVAVGGVGWAFRRASGGFWPGRAIGYAAARIGELSGDPARLAAELARVRDAFGVEASVYAKDGTLVATGVREGEPPPGHGPHRFGWTVPLRDGGVLVVHSAPHDPTRGLVFIGAVLLALALA